MELIGDDLGVWKMRLNKVLKRITKVDDRVFHILSAFNVMKACVELGLRLALRDFKHAFVGVINEDGGKLCSSLEAAEGVLVNANGGWPRVLALLESLFKASVKRFEHIASTHAVSALHAREIDKVLTRPEYRTLEALGGSRAFLNAWDVLSEGLLAVFAPKSSFFDHKKNDLVTHRRVFHL